MKKPLTTEEATMAELDTVRESFSHRRWPPDVVMSFTAAEVIRAKVEPCCASGGSRQSPTFWSVLARALLSLRPGGDGAGLW